MIKYIKNTTLYIIAFLLFLFGNAVNVIHFCCDLCRTQGTEVFTENNCHESENIASVSVNSINTPDRSSSCTDHLQTQLPFQLNHQHNSCSLETISINLDYFHKNIKVIPVVLTLFQDLNEQLQNLAVSAAKSVKPPLYTSAVHLSGRSLLNNICVLRN